MLCGALAGPLVNGMTSRTLTDAQDHRTRHNPASAGRNRNAGFIVRRSNAIPHRFAKNPLDGKPVSSRVSFALQDNPDGWHSHSYTGPAASLQNFRDG
jgi:hypothetical protein